MNKTQLQRYIRQVVKEQVDLRTKEGRELKDMLGVLVDRQRQFDEYSDSIKEVLAKQGSLKKERDAAHKVLFNRMSELEHKTLQVADTLAEIVENPKYKRVEPNYKELYETAYAALANLSREQARDIDAAREAMLLAKRNEKVSDLSVSRVQTEQFRGAMKAVGNAFSKVVSFLSNKFKRTSNAADEAQAALDAILATA